MQKQQRGITTIGIDPGIANTGLAIVSHGGCKLHLVASDHIKSTRRISRMPTPAIATRT